MTRPYPQKCTIPFLLYPPRMWKNAIGERFAYDNLGLEASAGDYVLYLSIPFCRVKCKSCPYFIDYLPSGKEMHLEDDYVGAMVADMRKWSQLPRWRDGKLRAIYIGGGTGNIISTANLKRLVDTVFECFPVAADYSLTLEGNTRDYTPDKIDYVAAGPINRISLGVQSFDPVLLKTIGSPHAAESSIAVIEEFHKRGFYNIQLDLMFNLPGHTIQVWREDLAKLKALSIKHFTIYLYRVHEGTAQDKAIKSGAVQPLLDKESAYVRNMYLDAIRAAEEMGFKMYMFDHFAQPGYENQYNYWTFRMARDALGIGAGAYSFINGYRSGTEKDVRQYIKTVNEGQFMVTAVSEEMSLRVRMERYVIFALQYFLIDFKEFRTQFGVDFLEEFRPIVERLRRKGLITVSDDRIEMTDLGKDWHMNVMLEFANEKFWSDRDARRHPNWAMNIPMVDIFENNYEKWLGPVQAEEPEATLA